MRTGWKQETGTAKLYRSLCPRFTATASYTFGAIIAKTGAPENPRSAVRRRWRSTSVHERYGSCFVTGAICFRLGQLGFPQLPIILDHWAWHIFCFAHPYYGKTTCPQKESMCPCNTAMSGSSIPIGTCQALRVHQRLDSLFVNVLWMGSLAPSDHRFLAKRWSFSDR